jgi:hypothetical protein
LLTISKNTAYKDKKRIYEKSKKHFKKCGHHPIRVNYFDCYKHIFAELFEYTGARNNGFCLRGVYYIISDRGVCLWYSRLYIKCFSDKFCVYSKFRKRYPEQEVCFDLPDDIVLIPMDAILIEQVLINILENAVQHAWGMTEISFRVFVENNKAYFEISDNGEGI